MLPCPALATKFAAFTKSKPVSAFERRIPPTPKGLRTKCASLPSPFAFGSTISFARFVAENLQRQLKPYATDARAGYFGLCIASNASIKCLQHLNAQACFCSRRIALAGSYSDIKINHRDVSRHILSVPFFEASEYHSLSFPIVAHHCSSYYGRSACAKLTMFSEKFAVGFDNFAKRLFDERLKRNHGHAPLFSGAAK